MCFILKRFDKNIIYWKFLTYKLDEKLLEELLDDLNLTFSYNQILDNKLSSNLENINYEFLDSFIDNYFFRIFKRKQVWFWFKRKKKFKKNWINFKKKNI